MARAAVAAGGGRDGLGPPPPPAPSHNGPAGTFPPAERESRAGSPSPPRATWRGPFVWAAFRPFVPVPGVASSGEPPGPVPGWDRSLGIRLRSPDRVKVHLSEPPGFGPPPPGWAERKLGNQAEADGVCVENSGLLSSSFTSAPGDLGHGAPARFWSGNCPWKRNEPHSRGDWERLESAATCVWGAAVIGEAKNRRGWAPGQHTSRNSEERVIGSSEQPFHSSLAERGCSTSASRFLAPDIFSY